jgi:hypothetical protein
MRTGRKRFGTLAALVVGVAVVLALIAFGITGRPRPA